MVESRLCISNLSACRRAASTESFTQVHSIPMYAVQNKKRCVCVCVCESISKQAVCLSESCFAVQNLHNEPHGECRILRAEKERVLGIIVACL